MLLVLLREWVKWMLRVLVARQRRSKPALVQLLLALTMLLPALLGQRMCDG